MDRGAWRATVHGVASVGHHLATKLPTTTTDMFLNILFHYGVSQETGVPPWVGKIPWRRKWQSTPVFLPGEFHGLRSLVGYSPWGCKELDATEQLTFSEPQ